MFINLVYIFIIAFFLFIQGFFASSEMAIVSSNRIRLRYLAKNGNQKAGIIIHLLNNPDKLFGTTLLGINLAMILSTFFVQKYIHKYLIVIFPSLTKFFSVEILILLIMEPIILVFAELYPMSIARKHPLETALRNSYIIRFFYFLLFPIMFIPAFIPRVIKNIFKNKDSHKISREELEILFTGSHANIKTKTQEYIKELFETKDLVANDILVPISDVIAISEDKTVGDLKKLIGSRHYSRIPIYKKDIFNISGTVHIVNILGVDNKQIVKDYSDKLYIVPSTKPVFEILSDLKTNRKYIAIVVNEYGAVCGIITLEDILREIFGDFIYEKKESLNKKETRHKDFFDADITLQEFYKKTGIDFNEKEVETLGGIINLALGRIAKINEEVIYKGVKFKVLTATDKVVKKVKLLSYESIEDKK